MKLSTIFHATVCAVSLAVALQADIRVVTTTADSGPGSLREALLNALFGIGPDRIVFQIPVTDPQYDPTKGVWTLTPQTPLPEIVQSGLSLEGSTQSDFIGSDKNPFGPEIVLDGHALQGWVIGLGVRADDVSVDGLVIGRFPGPAIAAQSAKNGRITGCYLGTDPAGLTAAGNMFGISLLGDCRGFVIGSGEPGGLNLVSCNYSAGIRLLNSSSANVIQHNIIGLSRTGLDTLGNGRREKYGGILIEDQSDSNTISGNRIGGNEWSGVYIWHSRDNIIENNWIGTNGDFSLNVGNTQIGVWFRSDTQHPEPTTGNSARNNVIGWNGYYGVVTEGGGTAGNPVSENRISKNGLTGISIFTSGGPAPPAVLTATADRVTGTAGPGQAVEVFCDEEEQGRVFLGRVTADAAGAFSLDLAGPPPYPNVTATATDAAGNTSRFSAAAVTGIVADPGRPSLPAEFALEQNSPNPFNPVTRVGFRVGFRTRVDLTVFDASGRRVSTLVRGICEPGAHSAEFDAAGLPSGLYFARLEAGDFRAVRKMALLK